MKPGIFDEARALLSHIEREHEDDKRQAQAAFRDLKTYAAELSAYGTAAETVLAREAGISLDDACLLIEQERDGMRRRGEVLE